MGIRFQCPNGHKLNVKADLAGKRASCPECGAKLVVPGPSTEPTKPPVAAIVNSANPAGSMWFMQTTDGQQFGPATEAQFSEWIAAGRVGADSYVWREGWTEWKVARLAADLLPKPLAAAPVAKAPVAAPPVAPAATSAPATPPEPVIAQKIETVAAAVDDSVIVDAIVEENAAPTAAVYALRKQRHKKTQVTLAVLMLLTVIVLAGVLVWVIASGSAEQPPASPASTTAKESV